MRMAIGVAISKPMIDVFSDTQMICHSTASPESSSAKASRVASISAIASEAVFGRGEGAVFHGGDIGAHGSVNTGLAVHETIDEARLAAGEAAEQVVHHQHLARTIRPGAD